MKSLARSLFIFFLILPLLSLAQQKIESNKGRSEINQQNLETDGGGGGSSFWQSFKPSSNGILDRIDFRVGPGAMDESHNALDNLATIGVYEGEGTSGVQLSTGTLMLLSYGTTASKWREYILPGPINVTAESTYTFKVSINQRGVGWTSYNFSGDDVYPRGRSQHEGGMNDHAFKIYLIVDAWAVPKIFVVVPREIPGVGQRFKVPFDYASPDSVNDLHSFAFNIGFEPSVLKVVSIEYGDFLEIVAYMKEMRNSGCTTKKFSMFDDK